MTLTAVPSTSSPTHALTFAAVQRAAAVVREELAPTPSMTHPLLDRLVGGPVVVKHDNALPTGAFKVRGGVHLASTLSAGDVAAGLVTASTGNHAQSVAYAACLAGTRAVVVMPTSAPQVKREAVEALGARVVSHGPTMGEAMGHARALAAETGARFVDPADPVIVLGHATAYLELFSAHPDLSTVYVPVGSGTGAAGACLVRDELAPTCRVVGVQSESAPAAWRSWRAGAVVTAPCTTRVSGLATASGYDVPLSVLWTRLDDFLLVSDDEISAAARIMATHAHTLAEGAGAAALAGLLADRDPRSRRGVRAVACTGGNASIEEISALSARPT